MATSRRFDHPPVRTPRRKFEWVGGIQVLGTGPFVVANATSIIMSSFDTRGAVVPDAPFTIMRLRGLLSVYPDQNVIVERITGAFGVMVVNGEAFDAGVASMPTPWAESFDDRWLYHTYWQSSVEENPTTSDYQYNFFNHVIDGKAMRKVNHGDVVVAVIENQSSTGAIAQMNFRMGVKLH